MTLAAMQCSRCQQHSPQGAKFCQECGAAFGPRCAACGAALAANAKFCNECGAPAEGSAARHVAAAPPPAEAVRPPTPADADSADRRQAVVLFADITGYTGLCARSDPEQVQAMLGRFFEAMEQVVEAHGGRIFDRVGDAVMAVFGAPVAHGNDVQRALRAALGMHIAAAAIPDCDGAPVRLHIGMASGEVVAAVIRGGGNGKYSVTGDTVNLAARLDAMAQPGETLIADALYRQISGTVEAEARGEHAVKGFDAPVAVWHVLGLREGFGERDRLPFVGRQAELRQLVGALDAVRETGCGTALLVRGDAGIGKSRLVDELRARARDRGFDVPAGRVLDFGVGKGQDAIPTVLKALLQVGPLDDEDRRRAALQAAIGSGRVSHDESLFVNEWLDLPQPKALEAIYESMDNATRQRRASEALAALLRRTCTVRPQVVLVEDIHWASPELLRHLIAIARATAEAPLILLLTSRIEGDPIDAAWRASVHGSAFMTIDLAPLRPHEAQLLAGGLVEAASGFARMCIQRAEGNPLFLEQLLRSARGSQPAGGPAAVPPTIQSLVLERMDRLAASDRAALQTAAVLGKRFSLNDLRGVGATPAADCTALVAADLVRPDGADFLFAHALIQEAIYASTLKSRRRALHQAAARWFGDEESLLQAEHLDRAEDAGAAPAYLRAATKEAARLRFESALRLAERGAALAAATPTDPGIGCDIALLQGEVLREIGRSSDSISAFRSALDLAADDRQRCLASMGIAAGYRITGDFAAAMEALGWAEPIAERLELTIERSRIHHTRGNLYFSQGRTVECDAEHELALRYAEQCGDRESQARASSGLGDARYAQGRMRSALEHFRRCVALCEGQVRIAGPNRCMIGHCLWYENQLGAAVAEAQAARDDAERFGVVPVQVFAHTSVAQLLTEAGRFDEADAAGAHALALARRAGSRRFEATLLLDAAERSLRLGDRVRARADLEAGLALARQTGMGFIGAPLHGRLARVATGADERAQCLADGAALLKDTELAHSHLWFYRDAIEATLVAREWKLSLHYADALERAFPVEPLPWVELMVARARVIVAVRQAPLDEGASARLRSVRERAVAAGNGWALAGIDAALAAA